MKQFLPIFFLLFAFSVAFAQNVTNVSFHQEGNKVIIMYDLDKQADVSVFMSTDGGVTYGNALQHVTGAVGKNVTAGTGKRIEYDVLAEYDKLQGEDFVFKVAAIVAQFCPDSVVDSDGNVYRTIQFGEQCWMAENLRTTKYADGTNIALGSSTSTLRAYRYYPNNNVGDVSAFGYLYNWKAVMGNYSFFDSKPSRIQGICPTDWHVPSDAEWTQLTDYVGSNTNVAKALASTTGWSSSSNTSAVGNNLYANDTTGFNAVPIGYYYGSFGSFGHGAYFWSATQSNIQSAFIRYLYYDDAIVHRSFNNKYYGFSVRCLRDS